MNARRITPTATIVAALLVAACEAPVHPNDPGIPAALCQPRCQREHDCNPKVAVASCVAHCERYLSPRVIYDREDLIAQQRACSEQQACVPDVDGAIRACMSDAFRRLEPTASVKAFCKTVVAKCLLSGPEASIGDVLMSVDETCAC